MDKRVATADSSSYAQAWIDNIDKTPTINDPTLIEEEHGQGLATRLHLACLKVFKSLCHPDHIRSHENDSRSSQTSRTDSAQSHSPSSRIEKHQCPCCPDSFGGQSRLKSHLLTHVDGNLHDCETSDSSCSYLYCLHRQSHQQQSNGQLIFPSEGAAANHTSERAVSESEKIALKEQLEKFYLWGEGLSDGSLDRAINRSNELRSIVLELLYAVAKELLCSKWVPLEYP